MRLVQRLLPALFIAVLAAFPATLSAQTAPAPAASVEGSYQVEITEANMGVSRVTIVIARQGDGWAVKTEQPGDMIITSVQLRGEDVTLGASYQGNPFTLPGKISGDEMGGRWSIDTFGGSWKATRKKPGE